MSIADTMRVLDKRFFNKPCVCIIYSCSLVVVLSLVGTRFLRSCATVAPQAILNCCATVVSQAILNCCATVAPQAILKNTVRSGLSLLIFIPHK